MTDEQPVRTVVVSCGALALQIRRIAARRGWDLEIRPLPAQLHNRPERIRAAVDGAGPADVVAYADCGTAGGLDDLPRLPGSDCFELSCGAPHDPGTFYLTDFLVRGFDRLVWRGLGLDRHPELRDDYFGNYRRAVWLAQAPTPELRGRAAAAATRLGLAIEEVEVGDTRLEAALAALLDRPAGRPPARPVDVLALPTR
ncbi:MAG: DUF1638 domain-containing protein [Actinomycetota bacterium]|jgi:hypothetical protein|nr:DUF1638 domain-containing protein [Actinomycetota bacterium]